MSVIVGRLRQSDVSHCGETESLMSVTEGREFDERFTSVTVGRLTRV